jgi:hypothetical protein
MAPTELDRLRFDIELAIKLDTFVPRSRRQRSDWAQHVAEKIAERLRERWEFTPKPGIPLGPGFMSGMKRREE